MIRHLADLLQSLGSPRVLVLGDLILDRYTWGNVQRVSPEAPVLVLEADTREVRLGGAASVARLARGLDAQVTVAGVLGDDPAGRTLRQLFDQSAIDHSLVLTDSARPSTTKERFLGRAASRHPHQILRVDDEVRDPLDAQLERSLAESVAARLDAHQALLISDYNKGACTPRLLETVIAAARRRNLPVLVDPARIPDYSRYQDVFLLAPNRAEAALATGRAVRTPEDALAAGRHLRALCRAQAVIVKLDSEGMALVAADGSGEHFPTQPRPVHDVTGAGDMVLAVLGLTLAAGWPLAQSVRLANVAASLEVQRLGVAPVSRAEIRAELVRAAVLMPQKLVTLAEMTALAESYRLGGRTIALTNGCFDLLHVGHAAYLEEAARLGDVLVVAVNSDRSVRALKGPGRPVIPERDRAALVASLEAVDHVLVFDEETPREVLRRVRPDVLVKGGTYAPEEVVGREIVRSYGGRVCVAGRVADVSTTAILASLRGGAAPAEANGPIHAEHS